MGVQIFICTHSPEIVRDAYESDACSLYHLRSPNDIAPIYYQDTREVFEIFSRLGSSPADALFTKGAILVEGDDDVAIFRAGFPDIIAGYSVKPLSGRPEVVKEFARLQGEESAGNLNRLHLFIFDNDRKVQKLKDTKLVRHKQLQRYSIENYLLNEDVLYDLLQKFAANPPESRGIFPRELKEIALMQMDPFVIKEVYNSLEPPNAGLRPSEIKAATFVDASRILGERVLQLANSVSAFDLKLWMINFESLCNEKKLEAEPEWSAKWKELASGKEIFVELYRRYSPRVRDREFKRLAIEMMKEKASDDWAALAHLLKTGLA